MINGQRCQGEFPPGIPSGIDTSRLVFKNISIPTVPKGVTVSGTAVSWNNTDNAEYRLYDGSTSDADIKAEWKAGKYTTALAYTPVKGGITLNADGKRHDQTFTFETIPEGNYKLVIFKPGKYVPKIVPINVSTTDYDCGQLKLWLYGDVTGDGIINSIDVLQIQLKVAGSLSLIDLGDATEKSDKIAAANITFAGLGDNVINSIDALQLQLKIAGASSLYDSIL